ncbi:MAG: PKD domain-containing protein [Flavobacterium sp. JAD_PAG50586_2]|nr:MAG: PKD domain-containing protein [Flavobacterium sp. JAD_PAG50586_2]
MKIVRVIILARFIVLIAIFAIPLTVLSQQTRKVLFLGNSYTYVNDLPQIVSALATNTGDVFIYDSNSIGGYTLEDHRASIISQNKIMSNDWDYIVLQEQSQRPAFGVPLAFFNAFGDLKSFIRLNKPCAQITSFMTWGYQNGDSQNCGTNPSVCTYAGMDDLIRERYMEFSDVFESEVTPVGVVWRYIKENHPNINLYQSDGSHPSLAGSYLAACCFYTSLFRKDPTLITNNYGLDATTASLIRNATKSIVYNQMSAWYIGRYVPNSSFNYIIGNGPNEVVIKYIAPTYRNSVLWEFGDGATSTAMLPSHSYAADGTYTLRLTSKKCYLGQDIESVFERTVTFCAHQNTILPDDLILCPSTTDTIWTQAADSYQWLDYLGNPIAGATNQSLEVYSGYYSVITSINGCTERSPDVLVDGWMQCDLGTDDFDKPLQIMISLIQLKTS